MNRSIFKKNGFAGIAYMGVFLSLTFTSCEEKKSTTAQASLPTIAVESTPIQHGDVKIYQEWIASLRGTEDAEIRAQVSGYLVEQVYKNGSYVKKGDILFQIDKRPFEASLEQAKGTLAQHEAMRQKNALDVSRYTPLAEKEAIGKKQLDDSKQALLESEASIVSAKAALQQAQINLDFATIKAPISGLAGIATPSIGNLLSSATPNALTTISSIDPIRVDYSISENDYLYLYANGLNKGDKKREFDVILSNGEAYEHKGAPTSIDRNVNRDTGTINIVGHISNPSLVLRPGMYVRIRAVTKTMSNMALVPPRAIMSMQGTSFVVMLKPASNNEFEPVVYPVTPGSLNETGRLQIITPLKGELPPNMTIVVEGLTQALQRSGGKGKVTTKPYQDHLSQPVVPNKKSDAPQDKPNEAKPNAQEPAAPSTPGDKPQAPSTQS